MASQKGRDFLLKVESGDVPETYTAIGAARTNGMNINNNPVDNTTMEDNGIQKLAGDAGVQSMELSIDGLFKDSSAEEQLRSAAFDGETLNYQLAFPNGDIYQAPFVIREYSRGGRYDGLESFSAVLMRSGAGLFIQAEE